MAKKISHRPFSHSLSPEAHTALRDNLYQRLHLPECSFVYLSGGNLLKSKLCVNDELN